MFAMVEELSQSRMTRKEFCNQRNISINCFYYWQKKYRQKVEAEQPGFIPVHTGTGSRAGFSQPIVLTYPNGASLQLPAGTPLAVIGSLLRLV